MDSAAAHFALTLFQQKSDYRYMVVYCLCGNQLCGPFCSALCIPNPLSCFWHTSAGLPITCCSVSVRYAVGPVWVQASNDVSAVAALLQRIPYHADALLTMFDLHRSMGEHAQVHTLHPALPLL